MKEGAVSICLSNPRTAIVSVYPPPSKADPGELTILPGTDTHRSFERTFQVPADAALRLVPDPSHGKLLESYAAVRLTSLLVGLGATTRVTQSRLLSWEDLRRENVIVLGHEENNRWVAPLLERMPFRITPPGGGNPRMIVGSGPSGAVSFRNSFADDPDRATEQFALISMLPGAADARRVALISGLHSQATDMAAEFLATRETLRELVGRLESAVRSPGSQAAPWSFQAVLRTEVRDRVPMRGKIVDLRLIEAR